MLDWLKRKGKQSHPAPPEKSTPKQGRAPQPGPTPKQHPFAIPLPPQEPDYSQIFPLQPFSPESTLKLAPMLLIGLGEFGERTLERYAEFLDRYGARDADNIDLLAITLDGGSEKRGRGGLRLGLEENVPSPLRPEEKLSSTS